MSKCISCKNCMCLLSEETVILSQIHNKKKNQTTTIDSQNIYTTMCLLYSNSKMQSTQEYIYPSVIECNQFRSVEVN